MRRLLNVKVIKTRGLESMLIIVFILPSRPGGLASHVCLSSAGREWVDRGSARLWGGGRKGRRPFTNTATVFWLWFCLTAEGGWSSAGGPRQQPRDIKQNHITDNHCLWGPFESRIKEWQQWELCQKQSVNACSHLCQICFDPIPSTTWNERWTTNSPSFCTKTHIKTRHKRYLLGAISACRWRFQVCFKNTVWVSETERSTARNIVAKAQIQRLCLIQRGVPER